MNRVVVIGGSGFIGRPLVQSLAEAGNQIVVVDRSADPSFAALNKVSVVLGDYADKAFIADVIQPGDAVILLAYASVPKTSFDSPLDDLEKNLPPFLNLLEVLNKKHVARLVVVSSGGAVYGQTDVALIDETHPTNPISPYGITKLTIEKYAAMYAVLYGLPIVIARPSNAYGEGQRPYSGQGFIATAIASIFDGKPLTLYGETGTVRDYLYIDDLVSGLRAVLERGELGQCYNIGTGVGLRNDLILEQLTTLAEQAGKSVTITREPARLFDVATNVLDSQKLTEQTGWQAATSFEAGLQRTWDYFLQQYKK